MLMEVILNKLVIHLSPKTSAETCEKHNYFLMD